MSTSAQPRFYSTTISASKSANEIGELVRKYGARSFSVTFDDDSEPAVLHFVTIIDGVGEVPVELRAQTEALFDRLQEARSRSSWSHKDQDRARAHRIAWRQLRAYVEMMLEMVQNGQKPFHEAFMSDVMLPVGGEYRRVGDLFIEGGGRLALPAPTVDADFREVD